MDSATSTAALSSSGQTPSDQTPLRIALIGVGTVGSGVARLLDEQADRIARRSGRPLQITRAVVRDPSKARDHLPGVTLSTDPIEAATADDIDLVCELIGGVTTAREVILAALRAGKHVVTANKALVCEHGPELDAAAHEHGVSLSFEAAVAGGIPVISTIASSLTANQIEGIAAILNGTSNYILTEMLARGQSYDDALAEAQRLGYAEADPTFDVDGTDAAQKLSILGQLAFGTRATPDQFTRAGIDRLTLPDLEYAAELGFKIKLLATARLSSTGPAGRLAMSVQPTLVRDSRPLAQVDGAFNVVELTGDAVGRVMLTGPGAGQMPTASAVVADLIDVASGRAGETFKRLELRTDARELLPPSEVRQRYYLRLTVPDRPSVLAGIARRLGDERISIASVIQHEGDGTGDAANDESGDDASEATVPLIVMTHAASRDAIDRALDGVDCVCLPVAAD